MVVAQLSMTPTTFLERKIGCGFFSVKAKSEQTDLWSHSGCAYIRNLYSVGSDV